MHPNRETPRMGIGDFLQATSIHGLRYLNETRGWLARIVWLAFILTSFTVAVLISYENILNWQNSPVTITQASTVMLKEENISLPIIAVCPRRPDYNAFIVNYLNKYYSRDNDTVGLYDTIVNSMVLKIQEDRLAGELGLLEDRLYEDGFEGLCSGDISNETKPCHLIRILFSLSVSFCDTFRREEKTLLFEYVFLEGGNTPSNEGFKRFLEKRCPTEDLTEWPHKAYLYEEVIMLVGTFFSLFENGSLVLKSLDMLEVNKFERPKEADIKILEDNIASGRLGHLLGFFPVVYDRNMIEYKVQEFVFADVSRRLGLHGPDSFIRVARLINHFTYGEPMMQEKDLSKGEDEIHEETELLDEASTEFVLGLLELSLAHMNDGQEMSLNSPKSLLPSCSWDNNGNGCWSRVVTDHGVCFVNKGPNGGRKSSLLQPRAFALMAQSKYNTFGFVRILKHVNNSGSSIFVDYEKHSYDVMVMAVRQFATAKTSSDKAVMATLMGETYLHKSEVISIMPTLMVRGTPEFRAMDMSQRKCLYPEEKQLALYDEYSQANCYLECAWEMANERCGCVPWFLRDLYPIQRICGRSGNVCFKGVVADRYDGDGHGGSDHDGGQGDVVSPCMAQCPNDCETLEFDVTLEGKIVYVLDDCMRSDVGRECDHNADIEVKEQGLCDAYHRKYSNLSQADPDLWRALDAIIPDLDGKVEACDGFGFQDVENIHYVEVKFGKSSVLKVLQTSTMTTVDMISNIGGTLGLFCGFSVLSAVEILYWASKLVGGRLSARKTKVAKKREDEDEGEM